MGRLIAVVNQKGGVGKTTTVVHLAAALVEAGRSVLTVDLDPQASLTIWSGWEPDELPETVYHGLVGRERVRLMQAAGQLAVAKPGPRRSSAAPTDENPSSVPEDTVPVTEVIRSSPAGYDLVPASAELALAEMDLVNMVARERRLALLLAPVRELYDYIFVDCEPSLGLLTINALAAADEILIPVSCEFLAWRALEVLFRMVGRVRLELNSRLRLAGILPTMYDPRTRHSREIVERLYSQRANGLRVLEPPVHRSVRFQEAAEARRSVLQYAPDVPGAAAYRAAAAAVDALPPVRLPTRKSLIEAAGRP